MRSMFDCIPTVYVPIGMQSNPCFTQVRLNRLNSFESHTVLITENAHMFICFKYGKEDMLYYPQTWASKRQLFPNRKICSQIFTLKGKHLT